jgi:hypothetical protein
MSHVSPNIRPACGQTPTSPKYTLGGCVDQFNLKDAKTLLWNNVTKVRDWDTGSNHNPNGIPPYARHHNTHPSVDSCFPADENCCNNYTSEDPCCEIPSPSEMIPCGSGTSSISYLGYNNCFAPTKNTASSQCFKAGFKNAFAKKEWHGIPGKTSRNWEAPDSMSWCGDTPGDTGCAEFDYTPNPDTAKYLGSSANVSITQVGSGRLGGYTAFANQSVIVDRYSGVSKITACSSGSSIPSNGQADVAFAMLAEGNDNNSKLIEIYKSWFIVGVNPDVHTQSGPTSFHLEWHQTDSLGHSYVRRMIDLNIAGGTIQIQSWEEDPCNPGSEYQTQNEQYEFNSIGYLHTVETFFTSSSCDGTSQTTATNVAASLSTPYSAQQAYQDAVSLLEKFPINNDVQYPWRLDMLIGRGPLLQYDSELPSYPSLGVNSPNCLGSTSSNHTGQILGLPLPPGYGPFWNPIQPVYDNCQGTCADSSTSTFWFLDHYGENSVGGTSATNWVDALTSQNLFHGGWAAMNFQYTVEPCGQSPSLFGQDVIWVSKYAEVQIPRPSVNYARPCGPDKWVGEAASSSCVESLSGNTLTVLDTSMLASNQTASICGTGNPSLDGYWAITVASSTTVTLNHLIASGSQFGQPYDCGTTGIISMLRWPSAPAICGRLYINSTTGDPVTCSLETGSYLITGDNVWAFDKAGTLNPKTVTVLASNQIVFNNTHPGPQQWDYITSPWSKDWRWNDQNSKGDYSIISSFYNYRDLGEYKRLQSQRTGSFQLQCDGTSSCPGTPFNPQPRRFQSQWGLDQAISQHSCSTYCLSSSPCSPAVICVSPSPNVDVFPNGRTHQLPAIVPDNVYGSLSRVMIKQSQDDPFAEAPPCKCRFDINDNTNECSFFWVSDDGQCFPDDNLDIPNTHYYPHLPQVEARCSPPDGAPPLPQGVYLGCLSQAQIDIPTQPLGNICPPPALGEAGDMPWVLWFNEMNCICTNGRFAPQYEDNGVFCILPPP